MPSGRQVDLLIEASASIGKLQRNGIMAGGYRACFAGAKADLKARKETNYSVNWWQCTQICDSCRAVQPHKRADKTLVYGDFSETAAHRAMTLTHTVPCHDPIDLTTQSNTRGGWSSTSTTTPITSCGGSPAISFPLLTLTYSVKPCYQATILTPSYVMSGIRCETGAPTTRSDTLLGHVFVCALLA